MEIVHVTTLTQYNSCPYSYKNSDGVILPEMTYKGDVLNIAANSQGSIKPFREYHCDNFVKNLKEREMLKKIYIEGRDYVHGLRAKHKNLYQEAKMLHKYNEDTWIVGTPDIHYFNDEDSMRHVEDLKLSTHSRYGDPKIVEYDMQTIVYPLFVMNYQKVDSVRFDFTVWDKGNGRREQYGATITRDHAERKVRECMEKYLESKKNDNRPAENNSKKCSLCSFKKAGTCPLFARSASVTSGMVDDVFDF